MYIAYDLEQKTRGDGHAFYPKVKRVYIAGDVKEMSTFTPTQTSYLKSIIMPCKMFDRGHPGIIHPVPGQITASIQP